MHQFNAAPLDKVWLRNGFSFAVIAGRRLVRYEAVSAIGDALFRAVVLKPGLLGALEVAYLRRALDVSQRSLGDSIGALEQTVSLWERGSHAIAPSADIVLRKHCIEQRATLFRRFGPLPTVSQLAAFTRHAGLFMFEGTFADGVWNFLAKPVRIPVTAAVDAVSLAAQANTMLIEPQVKGGQITVSSHAALEGGVEGKFLATPRPIRGVD